MPRSPSEALAAGLAALEGTQEADGGFPLWQCRPPGPWQRCGALFSTACIVLAAQELLSRPCLDWAVAFIRQQRRPDGLWEYDPALGLPPDSDCTACALAALACCGAEIDTDRGTALLRSFWRADSGPFRTWRGEGTWAQRDSDDPIVNCNIVYALATLGAPASAPELEAVSRLVRGSEQGSRYYATPAAIAYAARRAGLPPDLLPPAASATPPARYVLAAMQWLCGMRRHDAELMNAVLAAQRPDGSWPPRPWCRNIEGGVWGSPAVTTALAVEMLQIHATDAWEP